MRQRPEAHTKVIDDLLQGRTLWGAISTVSPPEIRARNGDHVRVVQRAVLQGMLDDGLIVVNPRDRQRYILTEKAVARPDEIAPGPEGQTP
jgi:hypothetical protein